MSIEGHDDDGPADYGEIVGRTFLDKLLLAIIDGNTALDDDRSAATAARRRMERLREAQRTLLGQSLPEGRPPVSDEAVLRWMGSEHYKDLAQRGSATLRGETAPKIRSDRQLADLAVAKFLLHQNEVERLRKKFGLERRKWCDIAMEHDDVPEQIEHNLLRRISDALAKDGIATNLERIER